MSGPTEAPPHPHQLQTWDNCILEPPPPLMVPQAQIDYSTKNSVLSQESIARELTFGKKKKKKKLNRETERCPPTPPNLTNTI